MMVESGESRVEGPEAGAQGRAREGSGEEKLEMARVVEQQQDHAAIRLMAARPELFAPTGRGGGHPAESRGGWERWKNWKWRELLNKMDHAGSAAGGAAEGSR